jgi:hypothetical protein
VPGQGGRMRGGGGGGRHGKSIKTGQKFGQGKGGVRMKSLGRREEARPGTCEVAKHCKKVGRRKPRDRARDRSRSIHGQGKRLRIRQAG